MINEVVCAQLAELDAVREALPIDERIRADRLVDELRYWVRESGGNKDPLVLLAIAVVGFEAQIEVQHDAQTTETPS